MLWKKESYVKKIWLLCFSNTYRKTLEREVMERGHFKYSSERRCFISFPLLRFFSCLWIMSLRINCLNHTVAFICSFEAWLWSLKNAILHVWEQGLIIVLFLSYFFISHSLCDQASFVSVNHIGLYLGFTTYCVGIISGILKYGI